MTEPTPAPAASAIRHVPSHLRLWMFAAAGLALDLWTKHLAFTRLSLDSNDPAGVIIRNVMSFRRSLNPGALFGLGKGLVPIFIGASVLALAFVLYLFMHSTRHRRSLHIALGLVLAGALGNLHDRVFVVADVLKVEAVNGRTFYHAGRITADDSPHNVYIVEGLLGDADPAEIRRLHGMAERVPRASILDQRQQGVVRDFIRMEPVVFGYRIWPWVFNLADAWLVIGVGLLLLNFWWDRQAEKRAERAGKQAAAPEAAADPQA